MDGSHALAIISTNLKWPNGITVDQGNSRIYWVDANLDKIESSLFDGNDRQVVISRDAKHPFSVDVLGDRLFWSDWSSHEIKVYLSIFIVNIQMLGSRYLDYKFVKSKLLSFL